MVNPDYEASVVVTATPADTPEPTVSQNTGGPNASNMSASSSTLEAQRDPYSANPRDRFSSKYRVFLIVLRLVQDSAKKHETLGVTLDEPQNHAPSPPSCRSPQETINDGPASFFPLDMAPGNFTSRLSTPSPVIGWPGVEPELSVSTSMTTQWPAEGTQPPSIDRDSLKPEDYFDWVLWEKDGERQEDDMDVDEH